MTNGSAFMLGCGYALLKGAHVRTDMLWEKFSERRKGAIDLVSYVGCSSRSMITLLVISVDDAWYSFSIHEESEQTAWRPIMWPFRAAVPLAALLFMIQGVSESLKCCVPDPLRPRVPAPRESSRSDWTGSRGSGW